jgi:hypothetical protein
MRASLRFAWLGIALVLGCAEGKVDFEGSGGNAGSGNQGGSDGGAGNQGGAGGEMTFPCGIDCAAIMAPTCLKSVCNQGMYPGPVGSCVVVDDDMGTACEDDLFCTAGDTCNGMGDCIGGPANDCGMTADQCEQVQCNEASQSCSLVPSMNGSFCTPTDLCLVNATCLNGLCAGGQQKDCFFAPVPNECFVAVCDPADGQCKPEPGPGGNPCTDQSDLCTVNKICDNMGNCMGGTPKDCSAFTVGCNIGQCDAMTGNCFGMPINNGDPCDDLNACSSGEVCNNGQCNGGTPIVACTGGDLCCPPGCTQANDVDCSCNVNLATGATPAVNPGGGSSPPYTPSVMNNGLPENCGEWAWMANTPPGVGLGWASLTWPAVQTVGSMFIDAEHATQPACGTQGRDIASATVQYMDANNQWVSVGMISGQENYMFVFPAPVQAKGVRLWDVLSSPQGNGNTMIHEWYVWPGSNCPTPMPN